ncbi:MAG: TlpA family protein disulfide reductase [Endomicrobium sp.]|jgi:thiol-disulfide isomerase/thioredoxin|nr:TlpA family protein disulfide reductase [Endomicrobium sp.]
MKFKIFTAVLVLAALWTVLFFTAEVRPATFFSFGKKIASRFSEGAGKIDAQNFFSLFTSKKKKSNKKPVSAPQSKKAQGNNFSMRDTRGNTVKLSDYKGKVVFIDFWATWCPPCRKTIPDVKFLHERFAGNPNVEIIGINIGEDENKVKKFIENNNIQYTVLYGDDKIASAYQVRAIPTFIILDQNGNKFYRSEGYRQGERNNWVTLIKTLIKPASPPAVAPGARQKS